VPEKWSDFSVTNIFTGCPQYSSSTPGPYGSVDRNCIIFAITRFRLDCFLLLPFCPNFQVRGIFNLPAGFSARFRRLPFFARAVSDKGDSNNEKEKENDNNANSGRPNLNNVPTPSPRDFLLLFLLAAIGFLLYNSISITATDKLDWITFKQYYLPGGNVWMDAGLFILFVSKLSRWICFIRTIFISFLCVVLTFRA
jgi:hypothetical protein